MHVGRIFQKVFEWREDWIGAKLIKRAKPALSPPDAVGMLTIWI